MRGLFVFLIMSFCGVSHGAQTPDGHYIVDTSHAHIGFSVSHLGFSNVIGRFNTFDGQFDYIANGDSSMSFEIDAASVDTNVKRRDDHIRSDDFFEVSTFPKIKFSSSEFTYTTEGDPSTITGKLVLHGEAKKVTFDVTKIGAGDFQNEKRAGYIATTKINRVDFGIDLFQGVVGEEIAVTVNLELIKQ